MLLSVNSNINKIEILATSLNKGFMDFCLSLYSLIIKFYIKLCNLVLDYYYSIYTLYDVNYYFLFYLILINLSSLLLIILITISCYLYNIDTILLFFRGNKELLHLTIYCIVFLASIIALRIKYQYSPLFISLFKSSLKFKLLLYFIVFSIYYIIHTILENNKSLALEYTSNLSLLLSLLIISFILILFFITKDKIQYILRLLVIISFWFIIGYIVDTYILSYPDLYSYKFIYTFLENFWVAYLFDLDLGTGYIYMDNNNGGGLSGGLPQGGGNPQLPQSPQPPEPPQPPLPPQGYGPQGNANWPRSQDDVVAVESALDKIRRKLEIGTVEIKESYVFSAIEGDPNNLNDREKIAVVAAINDEIHCEHAYMKGTRPEGNILTSDAQRSPDGSLLMKGFRGQASNIYDSVKFGNTRKMGLIRTALESKLDEVERPPSPQIDNQG